jgi:hypothetical protein
MTLPKYIFQIHPFLLGLFPVAFLYAQNVAEARLGEIYLPMAVISGIILIAYLVLMPIIRDGHKRALVLSVFVFLFFVHGALVAVLAETEAFAKAATFTPERVVSGILILILLTAVTLILRSRVELSRISKLLTQVVLALLAIQVGLAIYAGTTAGAVVQKESESSPVGAIGEASPDIYYLILDGYGRSDVLRDLYDYDNRDFLQALAERGFYVADSSHTNYNSTAQSLCSSLNMNYLHLIMPTDPRQFSRLPTAMMLENNRVMNQLKRYGYRTVSFSTGYAPTEIEFADYYFSPGWALSEFQNHLLNTTPIPLLMAGFKSQFDLHRDRLDFTLTKLGRLSEVPSPKFVFAHISCPHPPFVFGPNGEPIERDWPFDLSDGDHYLERDGNIADYLAGYCNQVTYVSNRIIETIDSLKALSADPPVIIIQADHGPGSQLHWQSLAQTDLRERFSILNAYLLPGVDTALLYPSITPINSFRIVLNQYFGTEFQLLPDHSYFTTWTRPYNYLDVTDSLDRH